MSEVFREIDEDIRRERYEKLWKRYGKFLIAAVVLFVILAAGYITWNNFAENKKKAEGKVFHSAVELFHSESWDQAVLAFSRIADSTSSGYHALALLHQAAALFNSGKTNKAVEIYERLSNDSKVDPIFRDLGSILAAMHRFEEAPNSELEERLAPLLVNDNPWRFTAKELEAFRRIRAGDKDGAREIFRFLADDAAAPLGIRSRAAEVLTIIGSI